jgi:hypothetical protein
LPEAALFSEAAPFSEAARFPEAAPFSEAAPCSEAAPTSEAAPFSEAALFSEAAPFSEATDSCVISCRTLTQSINDRQFVELFLCELFHLFSPENVSVAHGLKPQNRCGAGNRLRCGSRRW